MNKEPKKIRIGLDLEPDLKRRLDKVIDWGFRNSVLEELVRRLVEKLEKRKT